LLYTDFQWAAACFFALVIKAVEYLDYLNNRDYKEGETKRYEVFTSIYKSNEKSSRRKGT
jgi:uncharacterized protein (DUF2236 family)